MRLTREQVKDLYNRTDEQGIEEVEVSESEKDGRVQFYTLETKVVRRPLKKNGKKDSVLTQ